VLLASEDMITQRIDAHLARAKRATVSVDKHLGDGRSEIPAEKSLPNVRWVDNMFDYDMTANNLNVFKLSDDSRRRFLRIETTSCYKNNYEFFNDYVQNVENNPVALRQI